MKSKAKYALMFMTAIVLFSSCGSGPTEAEMAAAGEMPAMETDFIEMKMANAGSRNSYPGAIEGSVNVDVRPQVTGYLEAVLVKEGDYVQKGQSLFKIRPEVYKEQVNSSEAALKAALANQATASVEVEKIKPLVAGKVVTEVQLKTAQAAYDAAVAQVEQARSSLEASRINAAFTVIKAPVSGYIGRIPNRVGNLVSSTDALPLTTLSDINNVFVYFSMSEADFIAYKKTNSSASADAEVGLVLADGSIYNQKGRLEVASGNVDRATGSISMKAIFPNPDKLLRAGGAAKVTIDRGISNIMQIPKIAVKDIQDMFFVFKLKDRKSVEMVPVEIDGGTEDSYFIKSGVKPGDKVAVNRIDMLQMGISVIPKVIPLDSLSR